MYRVFIYAVVLTENPKLNSSRAIIIAKVPYAHGILTAIMATISCISARDIWFAHALAIG
jgi:hypothetical protein